MFDKNDKGRDSHRMKESTYATKEERRKGVKFDRKLFFCYHDLCMVTVCLYLPFTFILADLPNI